MVDRHQLAACPGWATERAGLAQVFQSQEVRHRRHAVPEAPPASGCRAWPRAGLAARRSRISASLSALVSRPFTAIRPATSAERGSRPMTALATVLLPEPLSPTRPKISPLSSARRAVCQRAGVVLSNRAPARRFRAFHAYFASPNASGPVLVRRCARRHGKSHKPIPSRLKPSPIPPYFASIIGTVLEQTNASRFPRLRPG